MFTFKKKIMTILLLLNFKLYNCLDKLNNTYYDIDNFVEYTLKFNKSYDTENEFNYRKNIYLSNIKKIKQHNLDLSNTYSLSINQFTDMLPHEFNNHKGLIQEPLYLVDNYINRFIKKHPVCNQFISNKSVNLPSQLDWREFGVVSNVKNQEKCGSCWSFSATGAIEGAWAIKHELVSLSEQQLIDCSRFYGDLGCHGGLMDNAFSYAIDNGMCSEDNYPYQGKGKLCQNCNKSVFVSECIDVTTKNQLHLKEAVALGPVSVAIEADKSIFQFYSNGIINNIDCGTNLDHGVLIIGYGIEDDLPYWLVKNSWGDSWGDNGYVKILLICISTSIKE